MTADSPDLNNLMQRLRSAAALMDDTDGVCVPVTRPHSPSDGTVGVKTWDRMGLLQGAGWQVLLAADDAGFVELMYRRWLGRVSDSQGRAFWLEQLRLHKPRVEVLAMFVRGAAAEGGTGLKGWKQRLLSVLMAALNPRRAQLARVMRALLRRVEWRLQARARAGFAGFRCRLVASLDGTWEDVSRRLHTLEQQAEAQRELQSHIRNDVDVLKAQQDPECAVDARAVQTFLAALEARFRQGDDFLRVQLERDYLPRVLALQAELGPGLCLDVGCGRGVWLELLKSNGISGTGVDDNPEVVKRTHQRGMDVICSDCVAFLQRQATGSVLLITVFHVVEHLTLAKRLALMRECERVLRPGGLLILETPNPENVWVGTHTFHHDPTHTQPLTPEGLAFMATFHGLEVVDVPRLHPYPAEAKVPEVDDTARRLNGMTCGGQDFAVIARKRV